MLQIDTQGHILLDGERTGFSVIQTQEKTKVFHHHDGEPIEMELPRIRYSLTCDKPASGVAGLADLENDLTNGA
jgi:hypothetical protein